MCSPPTRLTRSSAGRRLITRTHTTTHAPFVELSLIAARSANCPLESLQHSTSTSFIFLTAFGEGRWGGGQHFAICGPKINTAGCVCVCVFGLCRAGVNCTQGGRATVPACNSFSSPLLSLLSLQTRPHPKKKKKNPPLKLDANEFSSGFPRRTLWN